jgi:asparagine synthase (glutamine-hydrolysing)
LYYHQGPEAFYFASEAKAILAVRPELRTLDEQGFGEFIACGCPLENRTMFKGLHLLPPAAAWEFRAGVLERRCRYFEPREWEEQPPLAADAYYGHVRDTFAQRLPAYFEGRQPVGVSLTGGLDTRMIMAWQRRQAGSLPCYSFGSMYRDSHDVVIARHVARACCQPFEVIRVGQEFLERFPYYAERTVYVTDGCLDVSHSPDLYVNRHAATIAPVRMTGNYGGEVLRAVRAFKPIQPVQGLFTPEVTALVDDAARTYSGLLREHPLSFALFKQTPWHHYSLLSLEQSQLALRSPFLDNEFVRTVFRAPVAALAGGGDVSLQLIADGNPSLRAIPTDRGVGDRGLASAFRRGLREVSFKAEYASDYGMPHWASWLDRYSPIPARRLFSGRHKFYHFRAWYRDVLADYVREVLLDTRTLARPYLSRHVLEKIVRGHVTGHRNYTTEIHKMLTLEHIHRLFIDAH